MAFKAAVARHLPLLLVGEQRRLADGLLEGGGGCLAGQGALADGSDVSSVYFDNPGEYKVSVRWGGDGLQAGR